MAIEASATLACLITSVKSVFWFLRASSIAVTASLTLATAASVFGRPIDLSTYSFIEAEISDRRLKSFSLFTLVSKLSFAVVSTIFVVTVVSLLKRCSITWREVEISEITFEIVLSAVSLTVEIVTSVFETDSGTLELVEVKALVEALVEALIEALVDALVEVLIDKLSDKLIEVLFDSFNDITSEFSSDVLIRAELFSLVSEALLRSEWLVSAFWLTDTSILLFVEEFASTEAFPMISALFAVAKILPVFNCFSNAGCSSASTTDWVKVTPPNNAPVAINPLTIPILSFLNSSSLTSSITCSQIVWFLNKCKKNNFDKLTLSQDLPDLTSLKRVKRLVSIEYFFTCCFFLNINKFLLSFHSLVYKIPKVFT